MKKVIMEIKNRWKSETPKFFKYIVKIGLSVSGVALAMHLAVIGAGAEEPQWWINIYPYIIAIPAGMAATAKLTRDYGIDDQK
jgi:hypothetical protein